MSFDIFGGFKNILSKREDAVKESIINNLFENAKEIQYEFKENGQEILELMECTHSLCTTLEAMFLHGLKDSFMWQTITMISGDGERRPEPSFWPPLLIFSHKQVIEQIQSLSQIKNEIGCCRSWIRLSINDSLFSSYLNTIRKNSSALNPYYKKYAFMKDGDNLEVASKILEGVEACVQINLPVNTSFLNQWTDASLQLAGLWIPPIRSFPIASGVDVAGSFTENVTVPAPVQVTEFFSNSISNSLFNEPAFPARDESESDRTESENIRLFLHKLDEVQKMKSDEKARDEKAHDDEDIVKKKNNSPATPNNGQQDIMTMSAGNCVSLGMGWAGSTDDSNLLQEDDCQATVTAEQASCSEIVATSSTNEQRSSKSFLRRISYDTLLVKHDKVKQTDWNDIWKKPAFNFSRTNSTNAPSNNISNNRSSTESLEKIGWEILPDIMAEDLQGIVEQTYKLAHEYGLDAQWFACKSCAHPLSVGISPAQLCSFTGHYYCESCMSCEQRCIPAKILHNWDFRKYSICKTVAAFFNEFQTQPFIDLKLVNSDVYMGFEEMAELQSLRIQLNFIRAYLFTCNESIFEKLEKHVRGKKYLYEHIHRYTIEDIVSLPNGSLIQLLQKAVDFGSLHIRDCPLCSQKGFICEICNSPKVLYPFHIDTTFRCETCYAVFHADCLNSSQPCPKCIRKQKRQDASLLETVYVL